MDTIKLVPLKKLVSKEAEEQMNGVVEIDSTSAEDSNSETKEKQNNGKKRCQIILRKLTNLDEVRRVHNLAEIRDEKVKKS